MFRIFNGSRRGLGETPDGDAIFCFFDVEFRQQLHHFKGANLAVFLAITLHCNEEGWAWPGAALLAQETGYNISTVRTAIRELCKLKIDGHRVLAKYQPRKTASDNGDSTRDKGGEFATNHYLIFPSEEEATACETKGVKPGTHLPLVEKPLTVKPLTENPLTKEKPLLKEKPKAVAQKSEKPKPVAEDHLDLAFKTQQVQDKLKAPVKYLENIVLAVLGMKKVPNHKYGELWESPLRDLLDQADQDIDRVETALRAAAKEGHANGMTMTTASSLHGLALKALAERGNGYDADAIAAREAAAREVMRGLAKEHGHL